VRRPWTPLAVALTVAAALTGPAVAPLPTADTPVQLTMAGTTWCRTYGPTFIAGDSQSSGQGADVYAHAWPAIVDAALPTTITNLARNGAETKHFLPGSLYGDFVDQVRAAQPSLIIIATGANEYIQDYGPIGDYRANLVRLLDLIKGYNGTPGAAPNTTILLVHTHSFDYKARRDGNHAWWEYGKVQYDLAVARWAQQVRFLDLAAIMPHLDTDTLGFYGPEPSPEYPPVHLGVRGHRLMAAAILGRLTGC
jgi:lysophospholipase L1-like esterase